MLMRPYRSFRSPWREMARLQRDMNRLFAPMPTGFAGDVALTFPAMNVWTDEDGAIVTAELPGVAPDDIDVSVVGDTLTLKGSRQPDELEEGETYHRRERRYGAFTRAFQLPFHVEPDQIEATFWDGVLQISLPRAEKDKPKKIAVRAG
jgi:HSP20 family protein